VVSAATRHKRTFLPANRVRSSTDCFPPQCRRCGDALPKRRDADPVRHQVVDIPKIEPAADDYWLHRVLTARVFRRDLTLEGSRPLAA